MGRVPADSPPPPAVPATAAGPVRINPTIDRMAAYSWRLLLIGAAGLVLVALVVRPVSYTHLTLPTN